MAKPNRAKGTLTYPKHWFDPEAWRTFIEMEGFSQDWKQLRLTDDHLQALQVSIMARPNGSPVIPGTGGLRKIRFAPEAWMRGKRGAARVLYVHFDEFGIVLLVAAYDKSEKASFPPAYRKAYRQLIQRQRAVFASRKVN